MSRNHLQSDDFRRQVERDAHDDAVKHDYEAKLRPTERVRIVLREEEIPY